MTCTLTYDLNSIFLDWQHAECEEGISHYRIYMNDVIRKNVSGNCHQYIFNNVEEYKEYQFYVTAVTNNNRISGKTNTVSIAIPTGANNFNYNLNTYL